MKFLPLAAFLLLAGFAEAAEPDAESLVLQADALDGKNQHKAALALLQQANQQKPNEAEILRRLASQEIEVFTETKNATEKKALGEQAMADARRAVTLEPNNARAHLALSIIYGRIASLESAKRQVELSRLIESEAQTAAKLDPKLEFAWHILGRWNYELTSFNPLLRKLAELVYGKFPECSYEKAAEYFKKAIALDPNAVIHHIELGRTYAAMGKKEKAKAELEKGLKLPAVTKDDEESKQRGRQAQKDL